METPQKFANYFNSQLIEIAEHCNFVKRNQTVVGNSE